MRTMEGLSFPSEDNRWHKLEVEVGDVDLEKLAAEWGVPDLSQVSVADRYTMLVNLARSLLLARASQLGGMAQEEVRAEVASIRQQRERLQARVAPGAGR